MAHYSPLFKLPRELRDEIYRYTLIQPKPIKVRSSRLDVRTTVALQQSADAAADAADAVVNQKSFTPSRRTALLTTCRQINDEATPIMYAENVLELDEYFGLNSIPPLHFRLVRNLVVNIFFTVPDPQYAEELEIVDLSLRFLIRRTRRLCEELKARAHPCLRNLSVEFEINISGLGQDLFPYIDLYALPDRQVVAIWQRFATGATNISPVVECFEALGVEHLSIKPLQEAEVELYQCPQHGRRLAYFLTQLWREGRISDKSFEAAGRPIENHYRDG